jgi:hypothetical protein
VMAWSARSSRASPKPVMLNSGTGLFQGASDRRVARTFG